MYITKKGEIKTKTFHKQPCEMCGKLVSRCGFAYAKHYEACKKAKER